MVANAEEGQKRLAAINEADGPVFKIKKDPRIIPIETMCVSRNG
jgi:hypothetical protein